jgi:hypothetical protein
MSIRSCSLATRRARRARRGILLARAAAILSVVGALAASRPAVAQKINIGPNVQVSAARPKDSHSEVIMAADPLHAERMIAGVHIAYRDTTMGTTSIGYVTFDGGKTWTVAVEPRDSTSIADAAVVYGPDGSAYFATLARYGIFRSRDGGRTWDKPTKVPPAYAWDREYLAADFTGGKYNGRLYMNATVYPVPAFVDSTAGGGRGGGGGGRQSAVGLYTSLDGSNFTVPITRLVLQPESILGMANTVVLSDGTVMTLYGHRKAAEAGGGRGAAAARTPLTTANYWLEVITSTDGGETWNSAYRIGDYYMNRPRSEGAVIPHLAVDPGSALFKDRLYVVWSDFRTGRLEIMFSYSSDKGRTWSRPIVVSDDRPAPDWEVNGPDNITPTVAVNKDGIVAVQWYDRRDFADNLGWNVRLRASLDGGETWSPSVKISEKPTVWGGNETWFTTGRSGAGGGGRGGGRGGRGGGADSLSGGSVVSLAGSLNNFSFTPGHNGAFAVDAVGVFHPMWIDNRTGVYQVWTTTVSVDGRVARNGGGDLADLADLSSRVNLVVLASSYDRQTNRFTFRTRLKNTTRADTLRGPLKARVLSLSSQVAKTVELITTDNQIRGVGGVIDFTSLLTNGVLLPDSLSAPKDIVFQLTGLGPFRERAELKMGFVNMEARILGPAVVSRGGTGRGRGRGGDDR